MTTTEIKEVITREVAHLAKVPLAQAQMMFEKSNIGEAVERFPEQICHEPAGYWAEIVIEQYNGNGIMYHVGWQTADGRSLADWWTGDETQLAWHLALLGFEGVDLMKATIGFSVDGQYKSYSALDYILKRYHMEDLDDKED